MSRLDAIRAALARGYDYHAEQAEDHVRDLLALADAMFIGADRQPRTPQRVIEGLRGWRDEVIEGCAEWHYYDDLANAVEQLV